MTNPRFHLVLSGLGALLLGACGGGGSGGENSASGSFRIVEASNGFGKLLPYSIEVADQNGFGTGEVIEIDTVDDLYSNLTENNPIKPPVKWKTVAELPNAAPGNHFIYARFNQPVRVDSVLSPAVGPPPGSIQVLQVDADGSTQAIDGRLFVGGSTYGSPDPNDPSQRLFEEWVKLVDGVPVAQTINGAQPGLGYPGTEANFGGSNLLLSRNTVVFVVDSDDDLTTHETFPAGVQIQMRISTAVKNSKGRNLSDQGVASSTVGDDLIGPEPFVTASEIPAILPDGTDPVDPRTNIEVPFTEPVLPNRIGTLADGSQPQISSAIQIRFGPDDSLVDVPFNVVVRSVFDLTRVELDPLFDFPGSGPPGTTTGCGDFSRVQVTVNIATIPDLAGNLNQRSTTPAEFYTDEGPGLVNAPVLPDAVILGRGGSNGGISVIDLNGFGQGPGNPTYDPSAPATQGNTNFPNNPNLKVQGSFLSPVLAEGTCTVDGGSSGPLTLARDSSLGDLLVTSPTLETVGDMAVGYTLDNTFNNGSPFGCQAGGGNICAQTGLKNISILSAGGNSLLPNGAVPVGVTAGLLKSEAAVPNLINWAPHPNPPPLVFPPLCLSPLIGGQEPTSIISATLGFSNLLAPGQNYLGIPPMTPPAGILAKEQNAYFLGPSPPQQSIGACVAFATRQQIGNFLYVVDRSRGEVVVLNSNRFSVIERITLPDPTSLAMSPNLDFLAVSNERANQVSFIDTKPTSSTFHQVVKTTVVGRGPTGIAWQQDNEDILVCNTGDGTMSIISAFNLEQRKLVRNQLRSPFEVVTVPRMMTWSFSRQTYYAFILNRDGTVAVFESGPDGVNGWGFDDVIGTVPFTFESPKAIAVDPMSLNPRFFVAHINKLNKLTGQQAGDDGGALTSCGMSSGTVGRIPLDSLQTSVPRLRDVQFEIFTSIGEEQLTGVPVDFGFDILVNRTAITNIANPYSAGVPVSVNGKSILKPSGGGAISTALPQFIFCAVPNSREGPGVVDVIDYSSGQRIDTNAYDFGVQSIPAPNVNVVVDYLRQ